LGARDEEHSIQGIHHIEGGEAKFAGFEDVIAEVLTVVVVALGAVWLEAHDFRVAIDDGVVVGKAVGAGVEHFFVEVGSDQ
jgi:hypothetical protein